MSPYTEKHRLWHVLFYEACNNREDVEFRKVYLKFGMARRYMKIA
jgi:hypothetical protein